MLLKLGQLGFRSNSKSIFLPTEISNLALWLDASDAGTITHSAGSVSQWDDKSGNNNHVTQGTASRQPTTNSVTIGSKNAIDFDGSDFMDFTAAISRTSGYTVFVVTNVTNTNGNKVFVSGTTGSFAFRVDQNEQLDIVRVDQVVVLSGTIQITAATDTIVACRSSAAGNNTIIDGVTANSNATNPSYTANTDRLGAQSGITQFFFDGSMGEIIVYTGVKTDSEVNQIGDYLASKWGTTWTGI